MALPSKKLKKVKITNGDVYEIIPERLQHNSYELASPTLTQNEVIATETYVNLNGGKIDIIKAEGTPLPIDSTDKSVNVTASSLGLSSAMKFIGTTTTQISDGSTTNPITINEQSVTAVSGNVVLYGAKEFLWNGSLSTPAWEELGDESSHALKTVTITGAGVLGGGGSLEQNRTITHNEVLGTAQSNGLYKVSIDKYGHISSATTAVKADIPGASDWNAKLDDVKINNTSVVTSGVANIVTNTAYNASTNKIATMADLPSGESDMNFNDDVTTATEEYLENIVVGNSTDGYIRYTVASLDIVDLR